MIEQPKTQGHDAQSGRLVLPAYPDGERSSNQSRILVQPEQLIRQRGDQTPKQPLARLGYFWRKDPAHKVLILATAMVLISGFIFVSLVAAFVQDPNFWASSNGLPQKPPTNAASSGTVDVHPTFPAPGGSGGSNTSSQPSTEKTPALQSTPTDTPTAEASPTQGPGGTLTVQITSIPGSVSNNTFVTVTVNAGESGATVHLQVIYYAYPYLYQSKSQVTDADGNATLQWRVQVYKRQGAKAIAKVTAVATDDNGQQATSDTVTVQVM